MTAGCSDERPDEPQRDETCELVISFSATLPQQPTRVGDPEIWDDPYPEEAGLPSETAVRSMTVYFQSTDGVRIAMTPTEQSGGGGTYHYKTTLNLNAGYVTKDADGTHYISGRIVALANYPSQTQLPADPFGDLPFDISYIASSGTIPMWGVSTVSRLRLIANQTVDAGSVKLLRAVPKITLRMADGFEDYTIVGAEPSGSRFLPRANCLPAGASGVASTGQLSIEDCFNPLPLAEGETYVAPRLFGAGTSEACLYPAERNLFSTGSEPVALNVTVRRKPYTVDGKTFQEAPFSGLVYLCDYDASGAVDKSKPFERLVRNHDYVFTLSLTPLLFKVSVEEWKGGGKVHIELQ